jgi:hypothetical protein
VGEPRPSRFPLHTPSAQNRENQRRPGPTGITVSTSHTLLQSPPGTLPQVTDTVPEGFRRHQVPTPLFLHIVNKGPPVATPACFATPFPRPDSRPPDTVRSAKATPAVWRPTTAAKRDWRSRHTATDPNGVKSRDVTAAGGRHNIADSWNFDESDLDVDLLPGGDSENEDETIRNTEDVLQQTTCGDEDEAEADDDGGAVSSSDDELPLVHFLPKGKKRKWKQSAFVPRIAVKHTPTVRAEPLPENIPDPIRYFSRYLDDD